jgi:hypothetical protein
MKTFLSVLSLLLLCSCAAGPTLHTSVNGNSFASGPTSVDDPRLRGPQFYMDDDKSPVPQAGPTPPSQFRATDNFCASNCQASRHSPDYCSRACGI